MTITNEPKIKNALRQNRRYFYLDTCTPYPEQETEELDDEIIARLNPISGAIENLEILFFFRRCDQINLLELPIRANFQLVSLSTINVVDAHEK